MYQNLLIPTDGSELSRKAVESGLALAALCKASVVVLQVVPRYPHDYFEGGLTKQSDIDRLPAPAAAGRPGRRWVWWENPGR